jgi:hypothetical protein
MTNLEKRFLPYCGHESANREDNAANCADTANNYLIEVIEWLSKNEFNIDYYVRLGKTNEIIKEFEKSQE